MQNSLCDFFFPAMANLPVVAIYMLIYLSLYVGLFDHDSYVNS